MRQKSTAVVPEKVVFVWFSYLTESSELSDIQPVQGGESRYHIPIHVEEKSLCLGMPKWVSLGLCMTGQLRIIVLIYDRILVAKEGYLSFIQSQSEKPCTDHCSSHGGSL